MTDKPQDLTRLVTDLAVATQTATLRLLEVEMQALSQLMPGATPDMQPLPTDEEVESSFENMPV